MWAVLGALTPTIGWRRCLAGTSRNTDDFEDMVDLADIWIPKYGKVYTYVVQSRRQFLLSGEPVAIEEWTGDEHGPYHLLGLGQVPQNIMHASPASHLEQLDALVNDMWRKCARQGRRQKDIHTYTPGGAAAAQQIQLADDGEWIAVNDTSDVGMMKQGGVDPTNYAFLGGATEAFDRMAGNLRSLSGLGAQTDTVGQEKIVQNAVGNKVDKMTQTVGSATTRLCKALGMMLWQDEFLTMAMNIPIDGTSFEVQETWKPGDREGNFLDYNFEIDVYSMQYQSPAGKLAKLNEIVQGVILPMAPYIQQQGGMIDMAELTSTYAELMNMPEVRELVKFMGGETEEGPNPAAAVPTKSPTSTRNYVRTNVSGGQGGSMGDSMKAMQAAAATAAPSTEGQM